MRNNSRLPLIDLPIAIEASRDGSQLLISYSNIVSDGNKVEGLELKSIYIRYPCLGSSIVVD